MTASMHSQLRKAPRISDRARAFRDISRSNETWLEASRKVTNHSGTPILLGPYILWDLKDCRDHTALDIPSAFTLGAAHFPTQSYRAELPPLLLEEGRVLGSAMFTL